MEFGTGDVGGAGGSFAGLVHEVSFDVVGVFAEESFADDAVGELVVAEEGDEGLLLGEGVEFVHESLVRGLGTGVGEWSGVGGVEDAGGGVFFGDEVAGFEDGEDFAGVGE